MASPARPTGSPASRRSTPSRSTPNGLRRVNGYKSPFRESFNGSPSRQALEDYGKVFVSEQRALKRSLDDQTSEQQAKHIKALDRGLEEHRRIRESAERELEFIRLQNEREKRWQEEREAKQIEDARRGLEQAKWEAEQRRVEQEKAREAEARERETLRQQEEEDRRKRAAAQQQHDVEQQARRQQEEKEESERRAREEAEAREKERQAQKESEQAALQPDGVAPPSGPSSAQTANVPAGLISTQDDIEESHRRYLELHQRLKAMRQQVSDEVKALGPKHKEQLTDWRMAIGKNISMLNKSDDPATKRKNAERIQAIRGLLNAAAQTAGPKLDGTQYIVESQQPAGAPKEYKAQLLFLLNYFAKSVIKQIIAEAGPDPLIANSIGVLAATIFARPEYHFNGQSMIDIMWAKYHKRCPVLFGISGDETTKAGRQRIGWERDLSGDDIAPEVYYLGVRGLGVGFANITLRNFAKSQNENPAPNRIFWQCMARILNAPPDQVQPTHFELLKSIIENEAPRIINAFGGAALALMRQAVVHFPAKHAPNCSTATGRAKASALASLIQILQQKYRLSL